MLPTHKHQLLKKSQRRHRGKNHAKKPSLVIRFRQLLLDLERSRTRFSSYTINDLIPICQRIAIQQMSSATTLVTSCPLICIFCENLIYEPITLYCGHTYCEQCIRDEEVSSSLINCPRCSNDIQGQMQSPIVYAREKIYSKNHFLKQIIDRLETLKFKRENILLCHQARNDYANKNYQQAINIYSSILEKCKENYFAIDHVIFFFHFSR